MRWLILTMLLSGCSVQITPDLIAALANDPASFCLHSDLRGGAGGGAIAPAPIIPFAGYGSNVLSFCRSNRDGSELSIAPDGTVTIKHGK